MKKSILLLLLLIFKFSAFSCTTCNKSLQNKIYDSTFFPNIFIMLSAFFVLAAIVILLSYWNQKKHARFLIHNSSLQTLNPVPLTTASIILGIDIGGFIDGIVLHQILQWHEMLSNEMPPVTLDAKSVNMFWDGIFHLFTLVVVVIGVVLLWKLLKRPDIDTSKNLFTGGLIVGWGLFNIVEGIIDHHILKLHNVREVSPNVDLWNYAFLLVSILMLVLGWMLIAQKKKNHTN